jgi:hypothetical protein
MANAGALGARSVPISKKERCSEASDGRRRAAFRSISFFELAERWGRHVPKIRRRQHLKKQKGPDGALLHFKKRVADFRMSANGSARIEEFSGDDAVLLNVGSILWFDPRREHSSIPSGTLGRVIDRG